MSGERSEREAGDWLAKRLSSRWTEEDQAAFGDWYAEIGNRVAYIRLDTAWQAMGRLKALGAGVSPGVVPPRQSWGDLRFPSGPHPDTSSTRSAAPILSARGGRGEEVREFEPLERATKPVAVPGRLAYQNVPSAPRVSSHRSERSLWSKWQRRAAAAGALIVVAGALGLFVSGAFSGDRYSTAVGALNEVRLVDGSSITLNTDTLIRVHLSRSERRVDLERGEAFFEVAHDSSRPFVVYAGERLVRAVGTKFSVRRESDGIEVIVTEGKVRLVTAEDPLGRTIPPAILMAGTVAKAAQSAVLVHQESPPEAEAHLSWRQGYLVFKDTTLEEAAKTFNRYNTRKIVVSDAQVANIRIGGHFRSNNIESFLTLLKDGFPIAVEERGDEAVLKAR